MKTFLRILLALAALIILIGVIAYADGSCLPVNHSSSVTGIVNAPPVKVYAIITDVAAGPTWRPEIKSVQLLPTEAGHDHWTEDMGHGQTMTFLATTSSPTHREVLLDVPGAAYGGTWIYDLAPGPTPTQTTLKITENGFINPPLYRFIMHHLIGMTHNLDTYMKHIQARAPKP